MKEFDVLIVGAGVVGASLAVHLGRQGYQVQVIDRCQNTTKTLSGELLQPGGVQALEKLGLMDSLKDIDAQPVHGFVVFDQAQARCLDYPQNKQLQGREQKKNKPIQGFSFHHHRFVDGLRKHLHTQESISFVTGQVKKLLFEGERVIGVSYKNAKKELCTSKAKLTVLACGRNAQWTRTQGEDKSRSGPQRHRISYSVGLYLKGATLPHPHYGHVLLTKPAPSLMYQLDQDTIRVLIDIPGELPPARNGALQSFLKKEILPQLPEQVKPAFLEALEESSPQSIQIFQCAPTHKHPPGMVRVGDALGMRHPLTGGGMTVALNDAYQLSKQIRTVDWERSKQRDKAVRRFYRSRETMALTIDLLAGALYDIFKAESPGSAMMRDAVMDYWSRGGIAVSGPMELLAGLQPNPAKLLGHYLAVSCLGFIRQLGTRSSGKFVPIQECKAGATLLQESLRTLYNQAKCRLKLFSS